MNELARNHQEYDAHVSFGGSKYDTTNLTQEDGEIDKALAFSKPSDVPLTAPFKISIVQGLFGTRACLHGHSLPCA